MGCCTVNAHCWGLILLGPYTANAHCWGRILLGPYTVNAHCLGLILFGPYTVWALYVDAIFYLGVYLLPVLSVLKNGNDTKKAKKD